MPNGNITTERGKLAVHVINALLSEMVEDRAYEHNGKPVYNSLTQEHIDWVVAEFNGEHERMGKETP